MFFVRNMYMVAKKMKFRTKWVYQFGYFSVILGTKTNIKKSVPSNPVKKVIFTNEVTSFLTFPLIHF